MESKFTLAVDIPNNIVILPVPKNMKMAKE